MMNTGCVTTGRDDRELIADTVACMRAEAGEDRSPAPDSLPQAPAPASAAEPGDLLTEDRIGRATG